jgi:hypothetical protein
MRAESGFAGISQKRTEIGTPGAISTPRQLAFTPAHHTARGGRCERCGNILFPGIGGPSLGSDSQQTTNLRSVLHSAHNAHRERLCGRGLGLQGLVRSGQRSKNPEQSQDPKNSLSPPPTRQLAVGVVSAVEIFCFRGLVDRVWARTVSKPQTSDPFSTAPTTRTASVYADGVWVCRDWSETDRDRKPRTHLKIPKTRFHPRPPDSSRWAL